MLVKNGAGGHTFNSRSQASIRGDLLKMRASNNSSNSRGGPIGSALGPKKSWQGHSGYSKKSPATRQFSKNERSLELGQQINNLFRSIGKSSYKPSRPKRAVNSRLDSSKKRPSKDKNSRSRPSKNVGSKLDDFLGIRKRSKRKSSKLIDQHWAQGQVTARRKIRTVSPTETLPTRIRRWGRVDGTAPTPDPRQPEATPC